ncbi:ABC transporter substrate-binding protein [Paenibacillus yanchengensis]|uniref:ABC transporter substrate-binding protein n=1 Tax=Paenibacillus yanchengensis TaxID=2035833 RepID=A0ABW4YM33_9BACL
MFKKYIAILIVAMVVLTGCMAEKNTANQNSKTGETTQVETTKTTTETSTPAEESVTTSEKIEIVDGFGTQTFDSPRTRVVALEWSLVEELLITGVQPVGVADIENFNKWVTIDAKLAPEVVDVGGRIEPNIEAIANLKPDLILGVKGRHEKIKGELEKIAPVVMYDNATEAAQADLFAHMLTNLRNTGKLVGKEAEVDTAIKRLEERYAEAKQAIEQANLPTNQFVFTQAFTVNQAPTFRIFTKNSMVSHVLENIGLQNKISDDSESPSGLVETNVEGLAKHDQAMLIHTVQTDDPLFDNLKNNAAWNGFYFVKENQMYDAGAAVWTFGSVLSMETLIQNVVSVLTSKQ